MFESLPDYMKEIINSVDKNIVSKEKLELYQKEMMIISDIKKLQK